MGATEHEGIAASAAEYCNRAESQRTYLLVGMLLAICHSPSVSQQPQQSLTALDRQIPALLQKYRGAAALGVALIRDGQVTFSRVWGTREAGVPADSATLFNVASITKTVTAETILRLVAAGKMSLDEPIASYWVDPDVANDQRHLQLTPRLVLTHQTGFPNWRRMTRGGKLAFLVDPGTKFTYSGEGMNYLAHFAERKLGQSFESLVEQYVFNPIGMRQASLTERSWMAGRVAVPIDSADSVGKPWLHQRGQWSAAGDLFITVTDLARFLVSVMNGDGLGPALAAERNRIQVSTAKDMPCFAEPQTLCPTASGYGLGWARFDYGGESLIFHGGDNPGDHALVLYYPHTRDGVVVALNGGSRYVIPEAMDLVDNHPPIRAFAGVRRSPWGLWMQSAMDAYLAGKWRPE